MRQKPTDAEAKCWALLRNRRFADYKFRRQLPFGSYIADFVCLSSKLVIELDGSQHAGSTTDPTRDAYFAAQGFRIIRIWNHDLLTRSDTVLDHIWHALQGEQR